MKDREGQWKILEALAAEEDLELYDVLWPAPRSSVLRVFVAKKGKKEGVDIEECAALSKRILAHPDAEELLPGKCLLEVSSPGINRKLRLPKHFSDAVGERIRLSFRDKETGGKRSVYGILSSFDGTQIELEEENSEHLWRVTLGDVTEARVDFLFT